MHARRTVLIVEDDDDLRRMFRTALTFADFDVREAADGHTALADIDQHGPDIIVLDLGLPTLSGYIVLEELAAQAHTRNIPVVVVTGQEAPTQTEAMTCVLRKPVTPDRLVNVVRRCIVEGSPPVV
ncbi:MAG TPA: response regulator [Vicinamibacterales bacterium]